MHIIESIKNYLLLFITALIPHCSFQEKKTLPPKIEQEQQINPTVNPIALDLQPNLEVKQNSYANNHFPVQQNSKVSQHTQEYPNSQEHPDNDEPMLMVPLSNDPNFNKLLANFRKSKSYHEIVIQNVIDLVASELRLVRLLLYGRTGAAVDYALDLRNARLEYSMPTVVFLYEQILDMATSDYHSNKILFESSRKNKQLSLALSAADKRAFLLTMADKLEQYQNSLRALQYTISMDLQNANPLESKRLK